MSSPFTDLRYSLRQLLRAPGFTLTAAVPAQRAAHLEPAEALRNE